MWTIISTGDAGFLEQIFISVAMVVGTGSFMRGAAIAMLIGVLLMFFQSILKGGREFNLGAVLVGWILFMIMFIPTTTAVIEDRVTGSVRVVANVPLGVAASGSIISSIGYGLTELFEQGYMFVGSVGLTEGRFAESLNYLNRARAHGSNPRLIEAMNQSLGPGADIRKSWDNYIRECTLRKVDLGFESADQIMSNPLPESLRFVSSIYMTQLVLDNHPRTITCTEAYNELSVRTMEAFTSYNYQHTLTSILSLDTVNDPMGLIASSRINEALQNLGIMNTDAQKYMLSSVLLPAYEQAALGRYEDMHNWSSAIMLNQAIQQRNTQWASEQSIFMSTVRPLQTFFEGLVYAITPILAMLIVTGSFGFGMVGKYLMLLFWVQLWLPLLSIINLYINTAATGEISAYDNEALTSMYSTEALVDSLQNWIATGGMLAASVPMIALFVVSGSTYAVTSLAGRIGGQDHIDEKMTTPDVSKQAPIMQQSVMRTNDPITGTMAPSAKSMVGSMTLGSLLKEGQASTMQQVQEASQSFATTLGRAVTSSAAHSTGSAVSSAFADTYSSMSGSQRQLVDQASQQIMKEHGVSSDRAQQIALTAAANASLDGGALTKALGAIGLKGRAEGQVQDKDTQKTVNAIKDGAKFLQDRGWGSSDSMGLQRNIAANFSTADSESFSHELGDTLSKNLQQSAQDVVKASDAYSKTEEFAAVVGAQANTSLHDIAGHIVDGQTPQLKQAERDLNTYYTYSSTPEQRQTAMKRAEFYERSAGLSSDVAFVTARMEAMMMGSSATPDSINRAQEIIGGGLGLGAKSDIDPHRNAGFAAPQFGERGLQAQVGGATSPAANLDFAHGALVGAAHGAASEVFGSGHHLRDMHNDKTALVTNDHNARNAGMDLQQDAIKSMAISEQQDRMLSNLQSYTGHANNAILSTGGAAERFGDALIGQATEESVRSAAMEMGLTNDQASYFAHQYMGHDPARGTGRALSFTDNKSDELKAKILHSMGEEKGQQFIESLDSAAKAPKDYATNMISTMGQYNKIAR